MSGGGGELIAVSVTLDRHDPDTGAHRREDVAVRIAAGDHVLNLLAALRHTHDPTLSYPAHFCKLGTCGACALTIDGIPALACRTLVRAGHLTIGPPKGRRILADLLTAPAGSAT